MERRSSTSVDVNNSNGKTESTEYIPARCRITRPTPPKPAQNPLQFVKVGPCDLYRSAQEQLKKVEVIKKIKQEFKDDGEDWQANLDNWKCSRRKRQEHIIERVVEIRNMEQENDKSRRRSKTFSEMLEDRNSRRRKLSNLTLYTEDDGNDLADLGISTPSRKSSISGESFNADELPNNQTACDKSEAKTPNSSKEQTNLENTSSENDLYRNPTTSTFSSSTIINSDKQMNDDDGETTTNKCEEEYTYESAIQGYKSRVKRRSFQNSPDFSNDNYNNNHNYANNVNFKKMEDRRFSLFTLPTLNSQSTNDTNTSSSSSSSIKCDLPKIDILERKQRFETKSLSSDGGSSARTNLADELSHSKSIKERLKHLEKCTEESLNIKKATKLLTGDIMTVRDRLSSLVSHTNSIERNNNIPSWSSTSQLTDTIIANEKSMLQKADSERDHHQSPLCLMDKARMFHCSLDSLDIRSGGCTLEHVQSLDGLDYCERNNYAPSGSSTELLALSQCGDTDREDSGIQTADVSCSVSQADDPDDDSDTMAAINTVCVEQHVDEQTPTLKTYLSSIEMTPEQDLPSTPTSPSEIATDVASTTGTKSESSIVEELIMCTINMDLRKNKILFDTDDQTTTSPQITQPSMITTPISSSTQSIDIITLDPLAPARSVEPPKEKPPPPPADVQTDNEDNDDGLINNTENGSNNTSKQLDQSELKRLNSTKRIKNEIRNKRSSFLGIESDCFNDVELAVTKPPDATTILQEELQLEKEMYRQMQQTALNNQSHIEFSSIQHADVESRDSGVELESTKSTSDQYQLTDSVENVKISKTNNEDEISKKEREIIENLEKEEQWRHNYNTQNRPTNSTSSNYSTNYNTPRNIYSVQNSNSRNEKNDLRYEDDEDVMRVERELLELEQEELERQREDLLFQNRKANLFTKQNTVGLPDVYLRNNTSRTTASNVEHIYNNYPNYYQQTPPRPPAINVYNKMQMPISKRTTQSSSADDLLTIGGGGGGSNNNNNNNNNNAITSGPMSRHTLHALSATPKSKLMTTDSWIQSQPIMKKTPSMPMTLTSTQHDRDYNQHWLIQEAEERRLSERSSRNLKYHRNFNDTNKGHLGASDSALSSRHVQNRNSVSALRSDRNHLINRKDMPVARGPPILPSVYERTRSLPNNMSLPTPPTTSQYDIHDKMLSVSGKKKCSHCGDELGRGAAMIIESLCLFYHMDCFKCCVCHVQLGDGLMGTDVRVRNHKLHCHNCYSSDDGVKFSCV